MATQALQLRLAYKAGIETGVPLGYSWGVSNDPAALLVAVRQRCSDANVLFDFLAVEFDFATDARPIAPSDQPARGTTGAWTYGTATEQRQWERAALLAKASRAPLVVSTYGMDNSQHDWCVLTLVLELNLARLPLALTNASGATLDLLTQLVLSRDAPESFCSAYNIYAQATSSWAGQDAAVAWPDSPTDLLPLDPAVLSLACRVAATSQEALFACYVDYPSQRVWNLPQRRWQPLAIGPDVKQPLGVLAFANPVPWQLALDAFVTPAVRGKWLFIDSLEAVERALSRTDCLLAPTWHDCYRSLCSDTQGYCDLSWLDYLVLHCGPAPATEPWVLVVTDRLLCTLLSTEGWKPPLDNVLLVCTGQPIASLDAVWCRAGDSLTTDTLDSYAKGLAVCAVASLADVPEHLSVAVLVPNMIDLTAKPRDLIANPRFAHSQITPTLAYNPDLRLLRRVAVWLWPVADAVACTDWVGVLQAYTKDQPGRPSLPLLVMLESP